MTRAVSADDPCAAPWCCLTCSARFVFGQVRAGDCDDAHPLGLSCPVCTSGNLHPAGGQVVALTVYQGQRGTLQ